MEGRIPPGGEHADAQGMHTHDRGHAMQRLLRALFLSGIVVASVLLHGCGGGGGTPGTGDIDGGSVGTASHAIIRSSPYPNLVIEADYYPGSAPEAGVLTFLQNHLLSVTAKTSATISPLSNEIASPASKTSYSESDIRTIEAANRGTHTSGDTVSLYLLFLNGPLSTDPTPAITVGLSYEGTGYAMFQSVLAANAGGADSPYSLLKLEESDVIHEIGHLMGLVNLSIGMVTPHQDPGHSYHCNNPNCALYYSLLDRTTTPPVYPNLSYDANCLNDINAAK
jgi:hypothetical protein